MANSFGLHIDLIEPKIGDTVYYLSGDYPIVITAKISERRTHYDGYPYYILDSGIGIELSSLFATELEAYEQIEADIRFSLSELLSDELLSDER